MTPLALYRSTLSASTCIPSSLDKETHDRVLNWAAAMMWPQLAPHVRRQMGNMILKPRSMGMSTMVANVKS